MLEVLKIKNFAIIDDAEVQFKEGLNIISGETGAGKSIVLDALTLVLGGRATSDFIRTGADEAVVEGFFDISEMPWIQERLSKQGFSSAETGTLLIKRTMNRSGKNRIYVNGELATLSLLEQLSHGLVDLCSQHEHQTLTKPHAQLDLLDRFHDLEKPLKDYQSRYSQYRSLKSELEALTSSQADRQAKLDFMKFQLSELNESGIEGLDEEKLKEEYKLLQTSEKRGNLVGACLGSLESDEAGVMQQLLATRSKVENLVALDPALESIQSSIQTGIAALEQLQFSLEKYQRTIGLDPTQLEQVHSQLAKIGTLKRKYQCASVEELRKFQQKLSENLDTLENLTERIADVESQISIAETDVRGIADELSKARRKTAQKLEREITAELHDLKMEGVKFSIKLDPIQEIGAWNSKTGADHVEFFIQTNTGEGLYPLGKIASGGELSRVLLAIRKVIAHRGPIGVYFFDEVDAGMGGATAFQVGKKLKSVSLFNQVLCITHLPQVAVYADWHLTVEKSVKGKRTVSEFKPLTPKTQQEEIARMLGGDQVTKGSLKNALELIAMAAKR